MVNETVLSRMVKDFGDQVMQVITADLYGSSLSNLLMMVGGTAALISLGFSMHRGEVPRRAIGFFLAWIACLPVGGKPFGYVLVNGLGTSLAYQLQKTSLKVLGGSGLSTSMPPGWVISAIMRASGAEIADPGLQQDLGLVLDSCIPNIPNEDGEPLTAADLFSGELRQSSANAQSYDERFDPTPMRRRRIMRQGNEISCYDLLVDVRGRLRQHIEAKGLTQPEGGNYLAVSSGEVTDPGKVRTTWPEPTSPEALRVKTVAINLATAAALQKAALGLGGQVSDNVISPEVAATMHAAQGGAGNWLTRATFDLMSVPTAIARSFNVDGSIKSGLILQELNEKLLSLPYYIAFVQSILKILAPLAVLSLLLGTCRGYMMWSLVWLLTLVMPVVMQLSRGISNAVLFHTNKLGETAHLLASEPGMLAHAVSFEAATKIAADSSRMMNVILNVELGIWAALLALVPTAGWFAGGVANRAMGAVASGLVTGVMRGIAYKTGGIVALKGINAASAVGRRIGQQTTRLRSRSEQAMAKQTVTLNKPGSAFKPPAKGNEGGKV